MTQPSRNEDLDEVVRVEGGQVLATLIRLMGDIDRAEDALQDAVVAAVETWAGTGIPDKPAAWLTTVARHKGLDRLRRDARRVPKELQAVRLLTDPDERAGQDDRLRLLFTCCHPALAEEAQIALALRTICGLSTADIARAFVVPEPTIGQRISRAKSKIARAGIPYRVPPAHELPERLRAVLRVVYLAFTTGHHAPAGEMSSRVDLAAEGIRLGRMLVALMPDEAECVGLLAMMLATEARRPARLDETGELVLLADQDRTRWDHDAIAEASAMVEAVLRRGRSGPYQIQAAIACLHGVAASWDDTDWPQIAELYAMLESRWPTPVVRVNRAVAVAEAEGARAGLELLAALDGSPVESWHLYWAARADLERRAGDVAAASRSYERALACPSNDTDRRFLERRLAQLAG